MKPKEIVNINKQAKDEKILPQYKFRDDSIKIFEENYDLHCNYFKDTKDWKKKKNVYIQTTFIIKGTYDTASFGIRFVDDEVDENIIDLNSWSFDTFKED